ncbi:MAG: 50S ribosomal protein L25/general stress protein Ctc [Rhodospirillaceae bacterium]
MTETFALAAEVRLRAGKGTARQTRRAGRIPAVIYGNKQTPLMISLDLNGFTKILKRPGFFTHLFDVTVDGVTHRVLPRDVQFHPVSDVPEHVDFLRVSAETKITVHVPVRFVAQDKSPGLKRGGTLNVVLHEIELLCDAAHIPEHVDISLEGLDLGASVHLGSVQLPQGTTVAHGGHDVTVVTIATPSGLKLEAEEGAPAEAAKA